MSATPGHTQFRVKLSNIKGRNLPSKDSNGKSDPFLNCNFDNFKTFRTETIKSNLNPEWKFEIFFYYDTRYADKLDKKAFKIDCYDYDRFGSNDFIGSASVDLLTIATGPVAHDILMRDGGRPAGRLQFELEMEQISEVSVTFKEVHVTGLESSRIEGQPDLYLDYYYSARRFKSSTLNNTLSPSWPDLEQVYYQATLRDMLKESIVLRVMHNKKLATDPSLGECQLNLSKYLSRVENRPVKFEEPITKDGRPVGKIEGVMYFHNIPKYAQMLGGKHTETGILGGQPLVTDASTSKPTAPATQPVAPSNMKPTTPVTPQPQPQPQPSSAYPDLISPISIPTVIAPTVPAISTPTTPTLSPHVASASTLPPGWEERYDEQSQRTYYVDNNTQITQWNRPGSVESPRLQSQQQTVPSYSSVAPTPLTESTLTPVTAPQTVTSSYIDNTTTAYSSNVHAPTSTSSTASPYVSTAPQDPSTYNSSYVSSSTPYGTSQHPPSTTYPETTNQSGSGYSSPTSYPSPRQEYPPQPSQQSYSSQQNYPPQSNYPPAQTNYPPANSNPYPQNDYSSPTSYPSPSQEYPPQPSQQSYASQQNYPPQQNYPTSPTASHYPYNQTPSYQNPYATTDPYSTPSTGYPQSTYPPQQNYPPNTNPYGYGVQPPSTGYPPQPNYPPQSNYPPAQPTYPPANSNPYGSQYPPYGY